MAATCSGVIAGDVLRVHHSPVRRKHLHSGHIVHPGSHVHRGLQLPVAGAHRLRVLRQHPRAGCPAPPGSRSHGDWARTPDPAAENGNQRRPEQYVGRAGPHLGAAAAGASVTADQLAARRKFSGVKKREGSTTFRGTCSPARIFRANSTAYRPPWDTRR
jgi:hypothetical protein